MSEDLTLTAALDSQGVPFAVAGETFYIRPPTTEEYDDATTIVSVVKQRFLASAEAASLGDAPCSASEHRIIESYIQQTATRLADTEPDTPRAKLYADRLKHWRQALTERTAAQEIADDRALLARDRWLCGRLLTDGQGKPVCGTPGTPEFAARWERLPLAIKDAARGAIWQALTLVEEAPFSWARLRGSSSV